MVPNLREREMKQKQSLVVVWKLMIFHYEYNNDNLVKDEEITENKKCNKDLKDFLRPVL